MTELVQLFGIMAVMVAGCLTIPFLLVSFGG